jgi:hypothetical protein
VRQPFRQVRVEDRGVTQLQDSILEWIVRQCAADQAPLGTPTTIKHEDYAARVGEVVLCNPPAAGMTVSLPSTSARGAMVVVKEAASSWNPITVRPGSAGVTIDGQSSITSTASYAVRRFMVLTPILWGEI